MTNKQRVYNSLFIKNRDFESSYINDMEKFICDDTLVLPSIFLVSKALRIDMDSLKIWLKSQSLPTQADFFTISALIGRKKYVVGNYHMMLVVDFVFGMTEDEIHRWINKALLDKLKKSGLLSKGYKSIQLDNSQK